MIRREHLLLGLALTLGSLHCTPDFDSLKSGEGVAGGLGGTSVGGTSTAGDEHGGAGSSATGAVGTGGSTPNADGGAAGDAMGGSPAAGAGDVSGAPSIDGGEAGAAGAGPVGCQWKPASKHYDGFDGGLDGIGFVSAATTASTATTLAATASSVWDELTGKTCPGSLKLEAAFKGYVDGQQGEEQAVADLRFSDADWSGATKLHAWARVSPMNAPISGVRFFVMSGSSYLYSSSFDDKGFAPGQWYELVLPLSAGASYEPKVVHRLGVQIALLRAGTAGIPPVAPTVEVWLDDVWVE
jgi:hypothetical protein